MKMKCVILSVLLFFVLTPGILLRLPKKGSKYVVAGVHAIVFGVLLWALGKFVMSSFEGFEEGAVALGAKAKNDPLDVKKKEILDNAGKIQGELNKEFSKIVSTEATPLKNAYTKEYGDNLNALKVKLDNARTLEQVKNTAKIVAVKDHGESFLNSNDKLLSGEIVKVLVDKVKAAAAAPKAQAAAKTTAPPKAQAAAAAKPVAKKGA